MPSDAEDRRSVGITISHLDKHYGSTKVLDDVSLEIAPGGFVALLGPSGCGKTTLLRTIAGLEHPSGGTIDIGERRVVDVAARLVVPPQQRRLGMVFQHYALWPHMTVWQNICYPLRKQGIPKTEWEPRVRAIAELVGLPTILDRRPSQLSGGQQQRVALARALVSRPSVLLLDEPLSNLDANLRDQLRRELRTLHDRYGKTSILVTHDQEEATMLADVIAVINRGRVVQVGPPDDILERPTDRFVAAFVGYDNFIPCVIEADDGMLLRARLADGMALSLQGGRRLAPGERAVIAVRSTRIALGSAPAEGAGPMAELRCRIARIQPLGRWREISVDCAGMVITARERALGTGETARGAEIPTWIPADSPVLADSGER